MWGGCARSRARPHAEPRSRRPARAPARAGCRPPRAGTRCAARLRARRAPVSARAPRATRVRGAPEDPFASCGGQPEPGGACSAHVQQAQWRRGRAVCSKRRAVDERAGPAADHVLGQVDVGAHRVPRHAQHDQLIQAEAQDHLQARLHAVRRLAQQPGEQPVQAPPQPRHACDLWHRALGGRARGARPGCPLQRRGAQRGPRRPAGSGAQPACSSAVAAAAAACPLCTGVHPFALCRQRQDTCVHGTARTQPLRQGRRRLASLLRAPCL